ncbi:MAG: hypothetical protein RMZ41_029190 [Nostoc sp. DedVER02]|uniref:hypothetical protein n=1 Tax=unclassified Nostoc TaxID=2593658 RepID=UPI002AD28E74|nr:MULTISPECIES: hypothetical protein [unclassified Nostoc]MDZ7985157.1 hypothetical protein [Nostoc sp. DedVER02]MDZ8113279.1 hypothetical protein [Nostoc sp. DedVER01b]
MKIVEETRTRLQLKHRPLGYWFSGWCLFTVCLGFLFYCLFFESASVQITCDRLPSNQINCELKRFTLLGSMEKLKIFDPQEAYILTKTGSKGGKTYQVLILTAFGDFALLSNASYQDNQEVTFKINDFINSGQTSLLVRQNQRNYLLFLILFIFIMMAIAAYFATSPVTTCTFYKSIDKVFIERKSFRVNEVIEYPLENILRFDIQEKQFKYSKLYRAVIVLKLFQEIPINPQYTDERSVRYAVSRIHSFLKY